MKTKSNSLSNVICRRIRYVAAISLMLIAVLLTRYTAVANARRAGAQEATSAADVSPAESDNDAEYLEKRSEFLERFFGTGPEGVSPGADRILVPLLSPRLLRLPAVVAGRRQRDPHRLVYRVMGGFEPEHEQGLAGRPGVGHIRLRGVEQPAVGGVKARLRQLSHRLSAGGKGVEGDAHRQS